MKRQLTALLLFASLCLGSVYSQLNKETLIAERNADLEEIGARKMEIPKLQEQLKVSREAYKKQVAALPKGVVLICGDSSSSLLEESIALNKDMVVTLEKRIKAYEAEIRKIEKKKD